MIDAPLLALISICLQQAFGNNCDFGGISIAMGLDMNQLPPPGGSTSLEKAMIQLALAYKQEQQQEQQEQQQQQQQQQNPTNSPSIKSVEKLFTHTQTAKLILKATTKNSTKHNKKQNRKTRKQTLTSPICCGAELFAKFTHFNLTTQHHAAYDPVHLNFLQCLSSGDSITMKDLYHYKPLSQQDIANNPKNWKYAPILVSNNHERIDICWHQSLLYAKEHNTHVYQWPLPYKQWQSKPTLDAH